MLKILWVFVLFYLYRNEVLSKVTNPQTPEKVFYQLDDVDQLFKEFITKYNKNYDAAEYEQRHHIFIKNLVKMNRWNREQPNTVYGIGPFADLTFKEFVKTFTGFPGNWTNQGATKYEPKGMAPDSLDWRQSNLVTEVKNQGRCGSCYIFSAIANIEGQWAKKHQQLISLSEQQALDCYANGGCSGGFPHEVMQAIANKGCMRESDYPYEGQQGQCRSDPSKVVVNVSGGSQLAVSNEDELKDAVASIGPLSVDIMVNAEFQMYRGGIFTPTTPCDGPDGHAILLIGYGSDGGTPYWLLKNSWGAQWGEAGFFRMIRGQAACHIGNYAASATVA